MMFRNKIANCKVLATDTLQISAYSYLKNYDFTTLNKE